MTLIYMPRDATRNIDTGMTIAGDIQAVESVELLSMSQYITLTIEDINHESVDLLLERSDDGDCIIWTVCSNQHTDSGYYLRIEIERKSNRITKLDKGVKIAQNDAHIKELFDSALTAVEVQRKEDELGGIEHEINRSEYETVAEKDPYDPKLIRVETKPFSVSYTISMIESGDLDISPDFQREFVWTDLTRKSRLIESLLLRIPIPVFYISQDNEGLFQVVDGIQRLTVMRDFMQNRFRLKNLEYLTDCEGKWFKNTDRPPEQSLHSLYTRRIEQTQLFFHVIDPQTPDKVKYDIFRRINTGGKSLNAQEIRNCLSTIRTRKLLADMATSEAFIIATRGSISATRMADREIVLRFIAFFLLDSGLREGVEYRGGMNDLLDDTVILLNQLPQAQLTEITDAFDRAMWNAAALFGPEAFRKALFINKSLFLSLSRVLHKYDPSKIEKLALGDCVLRALKKEIETNIVYNQALSMATNDSKNIDITYDTARRLIKEFVK